MSAQFDGPKDASIQVIWEQCRAKGNHWLNECINLPASEFKYQVKYKILIRIILK